MPVAPRIGNDVSYVADINHATWSAFLYLVITN